MKPPTKEIILIDNNKRRRDLFKAARYWTDITGASIRVLSIIDESAVRDTIRTIGAVGKVAKAVKNNFVSENKRKICSTLKDYDLLSEEIIEVKVGIPAEEIKNTLDRYNPELVIMSPDLKSGIINITSEIIGYSRGNCFVTNFFTDPLFKSILLLIDNPQSDKDAINTSLFFSKKFGSTLYILKVIDLNDEILINAPDLLENIYTSSRDMLKHIVNTAKEKGINVEGIIKEGSTEDIVREISSKVKSDIIIAGKHSRTGLNRILIGSTVGGMIKKVACPLLIIKKELNLQCKTMGLGLHI